MKKEKETDEFPLIKPVGDTKRQKIIKTLWIFWAIMLVVSRDLYVYVNLGKKMKFRFFFSVLLYAG